MSDLTIRFYQLTIPQLREYARENLISLSGARLKADIIKRIVDYHLANRQAPLPPQSTRQSSRQSSRQSTPQYPRSTRQSPGMELSPSIRTLPYEMQYEIARRLDRQAFVNTCATYPEWGGVCQDERLWKQYLIEDFGPYLLQPNELWYQTYKKIERYIDDMVDLIIYEVNVGGLIKYPDLINYRNLRKRVREKLLPIIKNRTFIGTFDELLAVLLIIDTKILNPDRRDYSMTNIVITEVEIKYHIYYFILKMFNYQIPMREVDPEHKLREEARQATERNLFKMLESGFYTRMVERFSNN